MAMDWPKGNEEGMRNEKDRIGEKYRVRSECKQIDVSASSLPFFINSYLCIPKKKKINLNKKLYLL